MATQHADVLFWGPGHEGGAALPTTDAATTSGTRSRRLHVQGMPVGRWLTTTPGRLRIGSLIVVGALLLTGIVAALATATRDDATQTVASEATPELVAAESLFAVLADADATALTTYLAPGTETPAQRARYERDIELAGRYLARLGAAGGAPAARRAVAVIAQELPNYTGDVEASRAEARAGHSVSSSYLRLASAIMRDQILPQATKLYEHAAGRLDQAYQDGTSSTPIVLVIVAALLALVLLLALQLFLYAHMHRILNLGLAGATVVLVLLLAWTLITFQNQQHHLVNAQRHGSDAVQVLAASRVLALRAASDDILTLIEQGGGERYMTEYDQLARRIADDRGRGGLLGRARDIAARSGSTERIDRIGHRYAAVAAAHHDIREQDDAGQYAVALTIANEDKRPAGDALDRALGIEIARARVELDQHADDAGRGLGLLLVVIPLFTIGAILLVLVGMQQRIGEYR